MTGDGGICCNFEIPNDKAKDPHRPWGLKKKFRPKMGASRPDIRFDRLATALAFISVAAGLRYAVWFGFYGIDNVFVEPESVYLHPRREALVEGRCFMTNVELLRRTPCGEDLGELPCSASILHYRMILHTAARADAIARLNRWDRPGKTPSEAKVRLGLHEGDGVRGGQLTSGDGEDLLVLAHAWEELPHGLGVDRASILQQARYNFPPSTVVACWYDPDSESFKRAARDASAVNLHRTHFDLTKMSLVMINPVKTTRLQGVVYMLVLILCFVPCCFFMGLYLGWSALTGNDYGLKKLQQFRCDLADGGGKGRAKRSAAFPWSKELSGSVHAAQ